MDYMNPFAMYQNVNSVPNNPFWSGWQGAGFQQKAQPFIDMAQQSQAMDTYKKGIDTQEYASPLAAGARSSGLEAQTTKNRSFVQMQPQRDSLESAEIGAKKEVLPYATAADISKAKEARRVIEQHGPYSELISGLANLSPTFGAMGDDEEAKAQVYLNAIKQWRMKYPNVPLPEQFAGYNSDRTPGELSAIYHSMINQPKHAQDMERIREEGRQKLAVEDVQQRGATARTGMTTDATRYSADVHAGAARDRETPGQELTRLRREARKNPSDEGVQTELRFALNKEFEDRFAKSGTTQILQMQALQDPNKAAQLEMLRETEKTRFYADNGVAYEPEYHYRVDNGKIQRKKNPKHGKK